MLTLETVKVVQNDFQLTADIRVKTGEITAVIGPSGGGKSTLLNAIAGYAHLTAGSINWTGTDITELAPGARPISIIFQDHNLFPHLTVRENIAIGIRPGMKLTSAEAALVEQALGRVGLSGLADRKPAVLSGGQQSRVALARVLVRDRPLLLLDEPFAALGPALRGEMLELVAELSQDIKATVLMVTHNPEDAKQIAGQTVYVEDGLVHAPVATAALFAHPPVALAAYLGR